MTTPLTWITDRPPTEADGDSDGEVVVKRRPTSDDFVYLHWTFVKLGTAWRRSVYWSASEPAAPEPTPQPRRIVSITLDADSVAAVADDGTAWWLSADGTTWTQLPALPKRELE